MRLDFDTENKIIFKLGTGVAKYIVRLIDNETGEVLDFILDSIDDVSPNRVRWNQWLVNWPLRVTNYDYFVFEAKDSNWILALGFWNDQGEWIDTAIWYDTLNDVFEDAIIREKGLLEVVRPQNVTPGTQSFLQPYIPNAIIDGVDEFQEYSGGNNNYDIID
jgi:hypothetical protein